MPVPTPVGSVSLSNVPVASRHFSDSIGHIQPNIEIYLASFCFPRWRELVSRHRHHRSGRRGRARL
jgi:hypothetical protein